jgi:RNA polymerase sigma-B factor
VIRRSARFAARPCGDDPNVERSTAELSHGRDEPAADDVRERFERLRASGDPALREQLILDHRWIATQCSNRFRFRGEPDADLLQVALFGLVKATDRYDPRRDVPFHAFAIPTIVGELKRHFRDRTWSIGVPRGAKDLMPRLRAATEVLDQRLGRSPTVDELATELRVGREVVIAGLAARTANRMESLSDPGGDRALGSSRSIGPVSTDVSVEIEHHLEAMEALAGLDDRSRKIMLWRFYEELTQQEIGERLGIGQVQVSRLLHRAVLRARARCRVD